jgi:hypothetical protein
LTGKAAICQWFLSDCLARRFDNKGVVLVTGNAAGKTIYISPKIRYIDQRVEREEPDKAAPFNLEQARKIAINDRERQIGLFSEKVQSLLKKL